MTPRGLPTFGALFLTTFLLMLGCDDEDVTESGTPSGTSQPSQSDLVQGKTIAGQAGTGAAMPSGASGNSVPGNDDLSVLGADANQNQQAFRQRFGLSDPTPGQLVQWQEYEARLTAYSNKDADWQYPTAAAAGYSAGPPAPAGTLPLTAHADIPSTPPVYAPGTAHVDQAVGLQTAAVG